MDATVSAKPAAFPYANWGPLAAVLGVLLALGTGVVLGIPAAAIGHKPNGDLTTFGNVGVQLATAVGFLMVPMVIAAPISEEVCFRGFLFGGLRERWPRIVAALLSGLIFGGLHATTGVSAVPPLIVFGFILALLYEKTGSIWPGILLHMLNNSVALLGQ